MKRYDHKFYSTMPNSYDNLKYKFTTSQKRVVYEDFSSLQRNCALIDIDAIFSELIKELIC